MKKKNDGKIPSSVLSLGVEPRPENASYRSDM
jgi:hypothetical protein